MALTESIRFSSPDLNCFSSVPWPYDELHFVQFYANAFTAVRYANVNSPFFPNYLIEIDDGGPFAFDLEWKPDTPHHRSNFSLIQFASSKGVLVVQCPTDSAPDGTLRDFLTSHQFYGKGISQDRAKLKRRFGETFVVTNFHDIEKFILAVYDLSVNFEAMLCELQLRPVAIVKDRKVTLSDWSA
jgi:hypothetical protein